MNLPDRIVTDLDFQTCRPVSSGAEKWLYRPIQCLDFGFVYLVDYMGNDEAIVKAARVSYGRGTRKTTEDRGLIRYLRRHMHTTPSEMIEVKFHCKMPIFVARQWIRHRTANVNEYSGRYSEMSNEFYLPDPNVLRKQSRSNRQGRGEELTPEQKARVINLLKEDYGRGYGHYREFLGEEIDLARELARIGLSVANYTEWYWKIDLHNLLHFLALRLDPHAQYEIRVYGEAIAMIVKDAFPIAFEAFEDYTLFGMSLSRLEKEFIRENAWPISESAVQSLILQKFGNKRETEEFMVKLKELRLVI